MNLLVSSRASLAMSAHLTDLDLELHRTGEADESTAEHLSGCELCTERYEMIVGLADGQKLLTVLGDIPSERERKIIEMARREVLRVRIQLRVRSLRRWVSTAACAAAAVLVMVTVHVVHRVDRPVVAAQGKADINGDGSVNVLDALMLAHLTGSVTDPDWDLNGDGRVDDDDVDVILRDVVSLGENSNG